MKSIALTWMADADLEEKVRIAKKWRANFPEVEAFPPESEIVDILSFRFIPSFKDRSFLHQNYVIEGLSIAQISAQIFSSKEAVRRGLLRANIPLREPHKQHGNPSQMRYGQRGQKGRPVRHAAEERVIVAIQDMRKRGLSLRQIASFLSNIGVPTKRRGKAWHPEMVKRILEFGLE